jgi:hypothetical protein
MPDREITYVTLSSGRSIDAALLICPECKTLDLNTDIDTDTLPWRATCPLDHQWTFWPSEGNLERVN